MSKASIASGLIGMGLDFGASMYSSAKAYKSQMATNESNLQIMREQMAFQKEASQNAHQWEVADLRKAGLNPILSSKYGGASVGSVPSPNMVSPGSGVPDSLGALTTARTVADIRAKREEAKLSKKLQKKSDEEAKTQKTQQQLNKILSLRGKYDASSAKEHARVNKVIADVKASKYGKKLEYVGQTTGAIGNILRGSVQMNRIAK